MHRLFGSNLPTTLGSVAALLAIVSFMWVQVRRAHKAGTTLLGKWIGRHIAHAAGQAAADAATAHLREMVTAELAPVVAQLSPNSGSSMADKVTRLDQRLADFTLAVADDFRSVNEHLTEQDRAMRQHLRDHARSR